MPIFTFVLAAVSGLIAAAAAGALSGARLAGHDLGIRLAAYLGGLYGLLSGLGAVAAGLLITQLL